MEQPFVNLGSLRLPEAPALRGPLTTRWVHRMERHQQVFFAVAPEAIVVCACKEVSDGEWYRCEEYRSVLLCPHSGAVRLELPGRIPVGRSGTDLLTVSEELYRGDLVAHDLTGGATRWRRAYARVPSSALRALPYGLCTWDQEQAGSLRFFKSGRSGADTPTELPGLRWGKTAQVRGAAELLAVRQWDGCQAAVYHVGEPIPRLVWQRSWDGYQDLEVLVDEGGWLCRAPEALEAFAADAQPLWRSGGAKRLWLSASYAVGVRGSNDALFAVHRATGTEVPLPSEGAPWDLAVAGDQAWILSRGQQRLRCVDLQTGALRSVQELNFPGYGLARVTALLGRLYGVTDEGDVYCLA